MGFYKDIILSLEQMEKGEVESLVFRSPFSLDVIVMCGSLVLSDNIDVITFNELSNFLIQSGPLESEIISRLAIFITNQGLDDTERWVTLSVIRAQNNIDLKCVGRLKSNL